MPKEELSLDSVGNVDGGSLRIAVNQALKMVTQDLEDRPALKSKRKVVLTLEFEPEIDKNSNSIHLENASFGWHIKTTVPAIGKDGCVMVPQSNGLLAFHSDLPESPDDETIMDEAERRRREQKDQ